MIAALRSSLLAVALSTALQATLQAQEAPATNQADSLAKALSNPLAALMSVPLQLNYDDGSGATGDGQRWSLNVQPVIPLAISQDWNLISRTIVPVVAQSDVFPSDDSQSGLGDAIQSLFFSPQAATASGWIWGVGPAFLLPTATDELLGAEQWAIGPTAVALKQTPSGWTYGALANHLASFAGDDARADVNATFLQPFVAKALGKGATVSANFESTYDWTGKSWTLPLNLSYSKVMRWGPQLVSLAVGPRVYLDTPDGGPDWGARFVLTLLYPR